MSVDVMACRRGGETEEVVRPTARVELALEIGEAVVDYGHPRPGSFGRECDLQRAPAGRQAYRSMSTPRDDNAMRELDREISPLDDTIVEVEDESASDPSLDNGAIAHPRCKGFGLREEREDILGRRVDEDRALEDLSGHAASQRASRRRS